MVLEYQSNWELQPIWPYHGNLDNMTYFNLKPIHTIMAQKRARAIIKKSAYLHSGNWEYYWGIFCQFLLCLFSQCQ